MSPACVCVCVCVSHSVSASFQPSEALMEMNAASSTLQHWFNHTNRQSNLPLCVCVCVCVCIILCHRLGQTTRYRVSENTLRPVYEIPLKCVWQRAFTHVCVCQSVRVCLPMLIRAASSQGRTTWEKSALRGHPAAPHIFWSYFWVRLRGLCLRLGLRWIHLKSWRGEGYWRLRMWVLN